MIHAKAEVQTHIIGSNTQVWQYAIILKEARIGDYCNINCHTFIENQVTIGNHVTVKSGVYLWDGITIEDHVFIGPNVTFTNDKFPRSKQHPEQYQRTLIRHNASIGAAAVLLGGITVGKFAVIGAGSLVTKDVPDRALVVGSPACIVGWVNEDGSKMIAHGNNFIDNQGTSWQVIDNELKQNNEDPFS